MYKYKVLKNELLTPSVRLVTLTCEKETDKPLLHQPGQYAAISLHDNLRPTTTRCFSIVSSPNNQRILQFSMRVGGKFTKALERLEIGDKVAVRGPFGHFIFNQNTHPNLVMFAGGIGIAPFVSMIRYATEMNLNNKIKLVYSISDQNDIPFFNEIQKLQAENPNLEVVYAIGKGSTDRLMGARVISGRVTRDNIGKIGIFKDQFFMICGPIPYMNAMAEILEENQIPQNQITTEAFSQSSKFKESSFISWPLNTYSLTGLIIIVLTILIGLSDINRTFADQNNVDDVETLDLNNVVTVENGNLISKINSVGPQIDTDITQEPTTKYTIDTTSAKPVETVTPTPVITPEPTPAPQPAPVVETPPQPTTIVAPVSRPRTSRS